MRSEQDAHTLWKGMGPRSRTEAIAQSVLGMRVDPSTSRQIVINASGKEVTVPLPDYMELPEAITEHLNANGLHKTVKRMPRSTLSTVKLSGEGIEIESPAMPEREGLLYTAWLWGKRAAPYATEPSSID